MLTLLNQGTVKPTLARLATAPASIPRAPSAQDRPASSAPVQARYFGSGSTITATPPASASSTNDMGFSLGGILKAALPAVAHAIPGVSQVYDAIGVAKQVLKPKPQPAGAPSAGVLGNLPTIFTGAPAAVTPPRLPALPAGAGGGIVKATDSTFMTPDGQTHTKAWRQGGHYKKDGTWSSRRRPRMNPMNVRAVRRSVRRIHSAEKLFRRILSVSHPGKASGHISPKRSKRRA